jgi:outer membrane murein-binding lipoprotein Lpp
MDSLFMRIVEKAGIPLLLFIGGLLLATGQSVVGSVVEKKAQAAVQPRINLMASQIDTLKSDIAALKIEMQAAKMEQREFFGAQMDADSRLRQAVKERAAHNLEAIHKKKETEEMLKNLTQGVK